MDHNGPPASESRALVETTSSLPREAAALLRDSLSAARVIMTGSLATAQWVLGWVMQCQSLQAKSTEAWGGSLDEAIHEAGRATDLQVLLAMPGKLINQHVVTSVQQIGEGFAQWLETEMQWVNRLHAEAMAMAQHLVPEVMPAAADVNVVDSSPLIQLGRLQGQWLASTQRWLSSAGARAGH